MKPQRHFVEHSIDARLSDSVSARLSMRVSTDTRVSHDMLGVRFSRGTTFRGPSRQWADFAGSHRNVTVRGDHGELVLGSEELRKLEEYGWALLLQYRCVPNLWNGKLAITGLVSAMPEADQAIVRQQIRQDRIHKRRIASSI